jgi:catechol 2,3-dioxygenase-like lactoylglutathione lyase family enzyme
LAWSGISGIHHTALDTADFDATLAFYTDVLGLKRTAQWNAAPNRMALLDAGDGSLLEVFERAHRPVRGQEPITHFAFKVTDCKAAMEHVRTAGRPILVETMLIDTVADIGPIPAIIGFFEGPNGELVEFIEPASV